jgi:hypothetical protein
MACIMHMIAINVPLLAFISSSLFNISYEIIIL